mmetsp:Transcript_27899/g.75385  ORF Transcript_27899/g.75385 Transcript_27899/m.75385 type:complete len:202 (+) Transcript_27899:164-769(+)
MGCASSSPQEEQEGLKSTDRARTPSSKQGSERKGAAGEATLIKSKDGSMILAKPDAVEVVVSEGPRDGQTPPATERISSTSDGLKSLSSNEADNVQDTLMKVSMLVQRFGEGRTERTTAIQAQEGLGPHFPRCPSQLCQCACAARVSGLSPYGGLGWGTQRVCREQPPAAAGQLWQGSGDRGLAAEGLLGVARAFKRASPQ